MGIFGKKGPKTARGTMNRMVEGDGRKNYHTQTNDEIYNLSGGIFGKKKEKSKLQIQDCFFNSELSVFGPMFYLIRFFELPR